MKQKQTHHSRRNLLLSLGALFLSSSLFAQQPSTKKEESKLFLSTAPQHLLFGANLGIEKELSPKLSLGTDLTTHLWITPAPNIAISPMIKYYYSGIVGMGFYARAKVVGGYFFNTSAIDDHPFYAGGGIGTGLLIPLGKSNHWLFSADVGIKFVAPFGKGAKKLTKSDGKWGMTYYSILSPASLFDLSVGIAYQF